MSNSRAGASGGRKKRRNRDPKTNIYKPASILEDLFYKEGIENVLAEELLPSVINILKEKYGKDFQPWLVSLEVAMEKRSRDAQLVFFLIAMNQNDDIKNWICRCKKPLDCGMQKIFFEALEKLTTGYLTGAIVYTEYLNRLRYTLLFKTSLYTDLEVPIPDKNTHESFKKQFPATPPMIKRNKNMTGFIRIPSTTTTTTTTNSGGGGGGGGGDTVSTKTYNNHNNLPSLHRATKKRKLLNTVNHQLHLDPLRHKPQEQHKSQESHHGRHHQ